MLVTLQIIKSRNLPTLSPYNKFTGIKEWEYYYPFKSTDDMRNIKLFQNLLVLKYRDRLICFNMDTQTIVWEKLYHEKELVIFTRHYLDVDDFHPVDIFAVDTKTKEVVWKNEAYSPLRSAWNTPPYIFDGNVITASDWSVYSWNATTGELSWKTELKSLNQQAGFSFSGPFVHNDKIYAVENDGHVFCLDAKNGNIVWQNH
ncbi:MAG: PQQ-binding-like beta-propeller repeat protein [Saprospiraceae bacterium]|nr:PQQ-binding-like beta-propeller repeat protein [Saprospiraceae bacterium]